MIEEFDKSVQSWFERGSTFLAATGGEPRQAQQAFANRICEAISSPSNVAMIGAETGTGKTYGYCVPAALQALHENKRIVIATHSIELQKQVLTSMRLVTAIIEKETGKKLSISQMLGRRNFLCFERFKIFRDKSDPHDAELQRALEITEQWFELEQGLGSECLKQDLETYVHQFEISLPFNTIEFADVRGDGTQAYQDMVARSKSADIVVVNHALLVVDLITKGRVLGVTSKDGADRSSLLIVDEADLLNPMAKSMLSGRMPLTDLQRAINIYASTLPQPNKLRELVSQMQMDADRFRERVTKHLNVISANTEVVPLLSISHVIKGDLVASTSLVSIHKALKKVMVSLKRVADLGDDFTQGLIEEARTMHDRLKAVASGSNEPAHDLYLYWTPIRGKAGLAKQGQPTEVLFRKLWNETDDDFRVIFTSATLTARSGPEVMTDFAAEIGFPKSKLPEIVRDHISPEDFGRMSFRFLDPKTVPSPFIQDIDEEDDTRKILNPSHADRVLDLVDHMLGEGKNILVLSPAYRDISLHQQRMTEHQCSRHRANIMFESPETRRGMRERFMKEDGLCLYTTAWSGIDMPGRVSNIILPRIPFEPPSIIENADLESYLRCVALVSNRNVRQAVTNHHFARNLARTIRKVRQGFGRGIRRQNDETTIWFMDPRWPNPAEIANGTGRKTKRGFMGLQRAIPSRFVDSYLNDYRICDVQGSPLEEPSYRRVGILG